MQGWYTKGEWRSSDSAAGDLADALRIALLYHRGGYYADLDVIITAPEPLRLSSFVNYQVLAAARFIRSCARHAVPLGDGPVQYCTALINVHTSMCTLLKKPAISDYGQGRLRVPHCLLQPTA